MGPARGGYGEEYNGVSCHAFREHDERGDDDSDPIIRNSWNFDRVSEGESGPAQDNCDTTGGDGLGSAYESRVTGFRAPLLVVAVFGCVAACLVSNGGPGPTNGDHNEVSDDGPGRASRGRDEVWCGGKPHVNAFLSDEITEHRSRPAERMVSHPPAHRARSVGPPLPSPGPWNGVPKALSMSLRLRIRQTCRGVGALS